MFSQGNSIIVKLYKTLSRKGYDKHNMLSNIKLKFKDEWHRNGMLYLEFTHNPVFVIVIIGCLLTTVQWKRM